MVSEVITLDRQARVRSIVDEHHRAVARTLRKGGVPYADLDDEIQRTFIVAAGRLQDVRLGSERSFLCQVARNRASHARRSIARRRESPSDQLQDWTAALGTPEDFAARKEMSAVLGAALANMAESLRTVFLLHEVDEMALSEIATALRLPRGTVASRLRRAREQLRNDLAAIELATDLGVDGAHAIGGPALLRSEKVSRLARALLRSGTTRKVSASLRARTLAACCGSPRW
jgi:RNA polymerase sigma-70 factor (ECF subfamily)